jgi:hypothetical protein
MIILPEGLRLFPKPSLWTVHRTLEGLIGIDYAATLETMPLEDICRSLLPFGVGALIVPIPH